MRPHLFVPLAWPSRAHGDAPARELEPLALAEQQGYASVWLAEEKPWQSGIGPLLHLAAAWLVARSERIRIGVAGALLPSLHPLRMAEELAMLDALSAGRLEWAVADADDDPLLREQLAIVLLALTGESFAWDGDHFHIPELRCLPAAVQRPHPPLSIRAGSDGAIVRAARERRPAWNDALDPVARVEAARLLYRDARDARDAARAAGPDPSPRRLPLLRLVHVGESDTAARASAAPALLAVARAQDRRRRGGAGDDAPDPDRQPEAFAAHALEQVAIIGDESRCREQLLALRERLGPFELIAWHDFGGLPAEHVARSQRRLPEIAASLGPGTADGSAGIG